MPPQNHTSEAAEPRVVVAIDGPAGAGKSTVARGVAAALGVPYLDTGSMYRAIARAALDRGIAPGDGEALADLAGSLDIGFSGSGVTLGGRSLGPEIRTPEVNAIVSEVSAHPGVRRELVRVQQRIVSESSAVLEGRDTTTVVCPDADVKVFLTASVATRARRRHREMAEAGMKVSLRGLERDIAERDRLDSTRPTSPLVAAPDAHHIDSTRRKPERVIAEIVALAERARKKKAPSASGKVGR